MNNAIDQTGVALTPQVEVKAPSSPTSADTGAARSTADVGADKAEKAVKWAKSKKLVFIIAVITLIGALTGLGANALNFLHKFQSSTPANGGIGIGNANGGGTDNGRNGIQNGDGDGTRVNGDGNTVNVTSITPSDAEVAERTLHKTLRALREVDIDASYAAALALCLKAERDLAGLRSVDSLPITVWVKAAIELVRLRALIRQYNVSEKTGEELSIAEIEIKAAFDQGCIEAELAKDTVTRVDLKNAYATWLYSVGSPKAANKIKSDIRHEIAGITAMDIIAYFWFVQPENKKWMTIFVDAMGSTDALLDRLHADLWLAEAHRLEFASRKARGTRREVILEQARAAATQSLSFARHSKNDRRAAYALTFRAVILASIRSLTQQEVVAGLKDCAEAQNKLSSSLEQMAQQSVIPVTFKVSWSETAIVEATGAALVLRLATEDHLRGSGYKPMNKMTLLNAVVARLESTLQETELDGSIGVEKQIQGLIKTAKAYRAALVKRNPKLKLTVAP